MHDAAEETPEVYLFVFFNVIVRQHLYNWLCDAHSSFIQYMIIGSRNIHYKPV